MEWTRDHLYLRWTTDYHIPDLEIQVKCSRTVSLTNQECHLYLRGSHQQQAPVVYFQVEILRQAFLTETPRGG
ncbi:SNRPN upstream reading frame protein-like [Phoca vitulina]|uniref:SNRPN upstream reading frame protein-like n=1 Tax=Phoca vitulina TaxID=9720 RepID=UPI001395E739|nr:SNRPN upstream reading frame protein-like [Phoca vitulina]XP_035931952.1 SNRPN upstream reading frame protein-like [Halichoerus grypus]